MEANIRSKISFIEAEIAMIKNLSRSESKFDSDESNWKKIKPVSKKIRAKVYKKVYG